MMAPRYSIPSPLAAMLARLPAYPGSWIFVQGLNRALAHLLPEDVRAALEGKQLRLRISDAQLEFDFMWRRDGFAACTHARPDLTIGAAGHDFWLLARREEDPDTLFFSRRLTLEGDTELGLLFKNTLDALDASAFDFRSLIRARPARG